MDITNKSRIYELSDSKFIEMVNVSNTRREILEKIGILPTGGNYYILNKRLEILNLKLELNKRVAIYTTNVIKSVPPQQATPLSDLATLL